MQCKVEDAKIQDCRLAGKWTLSCAACSNKLGTRVHPYVLIHSRWTAASRHTYSRFKIVGQTLACMHIYAILLTYTDRSGIQTRRRLHCLRASIYVIYRRQAAANGSKHGAGRRDSRLPSYIISTLRPPPSYLFYQLGPTNQYGNNKHHWQIPAARWQRDGQHYPHYGRYRQHRHWSRKNLPGRRRSTMVSHSA